MRAREDILDNLHLWLMSLSSKPVDYETALGVETWALRVSTEYADPLTECELITARACLTGLFEAWEDADPDVRRKLLHAGQLLLGAIHRTDEDIWRQCIDDLRARQAAFEIAKGA